MAKQKASSISAIDNALPAVRRASEKEVQAKLESGLQIASYDNGQLSISSQVVKSEVVPQPLPKRKASSTRVSINKGRIHEAFEKPMASSS